MRAKYKSLLYVVAATIVAAMTCKVMDHGGLDGMHILAALMGMLLQWILIDVAYEVWRNRHAPFILVEHIDDEEEEEWE